MLKLCTIKDVVSNWFYIKFRNLMLVTASLIVVESINCHRWPPSRLLEHVPLWTHANITEAMMCNRWWWLSHLMVCSISSLWTHANITEAMMCNRWWWLPHLMVCSISSLSDHYSWNWVSKLDQYSFTSQQAILKQNPRFSDFHLRLPTDKHSSEKSSSLNPFTATMPLQNDLQKCKIVSPSLFLFSFSHWHVEGFSSKHTALKVDVTGPENLLFAGVSVRLSAHKCYRLGQWRGQHLQLKRKLLRIKHFNNKWKRDNTLCAEVWFLTINYHRHMFDGAQRTWKDFLSI